MRGYIRLKSMAVSSQKWLNTIDQGLEDFGTNLEAVIATATRER